MFEVLYISWANTFNKLDSEGKDGYCIINLSVPIKLLEELYNRFVTKKEIPAITELTLDKKLKYWNIAKKYHQELPQRLSASKAAYVLTLISGNS